MADSFANFRNLERIGAGAMGEVYRARDDRLARDVALKMLPPELGLDAHAMARMRREARILAELNHPHIAQIYDFSQEAGRYALVLELVEGPTLKEWLQSLAVEERTLAPDARSRSVFRLAEALPLAIQLTNALDSAHAHGVLHRDLKPSNLKLTRDGNLKVLDFGIAKHLPRPGSAETDGTTEALSLTQTGAILGTVPYMSPEQARGEDIDRRTDVWAFGCVLFEMITGTVAFAGDTITETIAKIITQDPEWGRLPDETPASLRRLMQRCLQRDPQRRLRDLGDAHLELLDIQSAIDRGADDETASAMDRRPNATLKHWLGPGLVAALALATLVWSLTLSSSSSDEALETNASSPIRFEIQAREETAIRYDRAPTLAVAPDGRSLVFVGMTDGSPRLYRRSLSHEDFTEIPGTEGASSPFFSPDGQWLGFHARGALHRLSLADGRKLEICATEAAFGACWTDQDSVLFNPGDDRGLFIVPSHGGKPQPITIVGDSRGLISHRHPVALHGGSVVLFTIWNDWAYAEQSIAVHDRGTGVVRTLVDNGAKPSIVGNDELLFLRDSALVSARFDPRSVELTTDPIVLEDDSMGPRYASLCASRNGTVAYHSGDFSEIGGQAQDQLVFVDRDGRREPLQLPTSHYMLPSFSPDGRILAFTQCLSGDCDIWLHDLERGTTRRHTHGNLGHVTVWTPDGQSIIYSSNRDGPSNLYIEPLDRSQPPRRLTRSENHQDPCDITPDGETLIFWDTPAATGFDLMTLSLREGSEPEPLVVTKANESHATLSPDGDYFAYTSDESGLEQVYVQKFRNLGPSTQLSVDGGRAPVWSRNGDQIFFRAVQDTVIMIVDVTDETPPRFTRPRVALSGRFRRHVAGVANYAHHAPTNRLLMIASAAPGAPPRIRITVRGGTR